MLESNVPLSKPDLTHLSSLVVKGLRLWFVVPPAGAPVLFRNVKDKEHLDLALQPVFQSGLYIKITHHII